MINLKTDLIHNVFWQQDYVVLDNFFYDALMDSYNKKIKQHFGKDPQWKHDAAFISKTSAEVIPWFPYQKGKGGFDGINENQEFNSITSRILMAGWHNL